MNSYIKQFIAICKGDNVKANAEVSYRQSICALKSQIHAEEGLLIKLEGELENAKVKAEESIVNNGEKIPDNEKYINGLINSFNETKTIEKKIETLKVKIELFKSILNGIQSEVKE